MKGNFDLAPTEWVTLRRLLDDALAQPPNARVTWVDSLAPDYAAFQPRLRALLSHEAAGAGALPLDTLPKIETAQFLAERGRGAATDAGDAERAGDAIGPYRLVRLLGEGGMGAVWLAERTDLLQKRPVALKLPRTAWRGARLAERLAREREILATLNHPNIARLYDAGVVDGQPYLALEYVEGERIDAYCARKALDLKARLRLFLQVALAVAHAHANLVVHRDLKPSNILVTESGEVRLLDFGIAKLLEDGIAHETEFTQFAGRALTPDYASPEQILGQPISTASDVYSLGVVLYELLAGTRPYKLKRDSRASLEDAIVQAAPARPSVVVAEPKRRKQLRGDLDTIVLKALKKEAAARYATVDALADDIERYLDNRAVMAQPDRFSYRLRKFAARNRIEVVAGGSVLFAIVVGGAVAVWQADSAFREQQRSERVKAFIASIFSDADPYATIGGQAVTALDLLNRASKRLEGELADQPEVRAELLRILGNSYAGLFDLRNAEMTLTQALAQTQSLGRLPQRELTISGIQVALGEVKKLMGKKDESQALLRQALMSLAQQGQQRSDVFADAKLLEAGLALNEGDYAAMTAAAEEAVRVSSALHGENNARSATGYGLLARSRGVTAADQKRSLEAAEKSYSIQRALYGGDKPHPAVAEAQHSYGVALIGVGDLRRADPHIEQSFIDAQTLYGPASVMAGHFGARFGQVQILRGDLAAGIQALRDAQARLAVADPSPNVATAGRLRALALGLLWAHRPAEAIDSLQQSIAILKERSDRGATLIAQADYAIALVELGRLREADDLLRAVDAEGSAMRPQERPLRAMARLHLLRGEPDKAQSLLEHALEQAKLDPRRFFLADILIDMGRAQLELGAHDRSIATLQEAIQELERTKIRSTPGHATTWMLLGRTRLVSDQAKDALIPLERADGFWRDFDPDNRWAGEAAFWLARCLDALGRSVDAKQAYARAGQILAGSPLPADAKLVKLARQAAAPAVTQARSPQQQQF